MEKARIYKAEYADDSFTIFYGCTTDAQALSEAHKSERKYGAIFNVYEIDEHYNKIRTIY